MFLITTNDYLLIQIISWSQHLPIYNSKWYLYTFLYASGSVLFQDAQIFRITIKWYLFREIVEQKIDFDVICQCLIANKYINSFTTRFKNILIFYSKVNIYKQYIFITGFQVYSAYKM